MPFVNSISMRLCSLSASAFFLLFSSSRSCCRKRSSSSCCCNSSFLRRSCISSRSWSNSNCCFSSRCAASFLALRFLSSFLSVCCLLGDRELAILAFSLLCVPECLREISKFSSTFSIALISVSITVSFVSLSTADVDDTNDDRFPQSLLPVLLDQVSIVTPNIAEIHKLSGAIFLIYRSDRFCVIFI